MKIKLLKLLKLREKRKNLHYTYNFYNVDRAGDCHMFRDVNSLKDCFSPTEKLKVWGISGEKQVINWNWHGITYCDGISDCPQSKVWRRKLKFKLNRSKACRSKLLIYRLIHLHPSETFWALKLCVRLEIFVDSNWKLFKVLCNERKNGRQRKFKPREIKTIFFNKVKKIF